MTKSEFTQFLATFVGLWPRWELTDERAEALTRMFGGLDFRIVDQALKAATSETIPAWPDLEKIRAFVSVGLRGRQLEEANAKRQREIAEASSLWRELEAAVKFCDSLPPDRLESARAAVLEGLPPALRRRLEAFSVAESRTLTLRIYRALTGRGCRNGSREPALVGASE